MSKPARKFNDAEIALMGDVTKSHEELADRLGVSVAVVGAYRRDVLGVHLNGRGVRLTEVDSKVNWDLPDIEIARQLKVGPMVVVRLRRERARAGRIPKVDPDVMADIVASDEPIHVLARRHGMTPEAIRYHRRKNGKVGSAGRPSIRLEDMPPGIDWNAPVAALKRRLGVSWPTADRLKAEAVTRGLAPRFQKQAKLPGFEALGAVPSDYPGVDWTDNTSTIAAYLKLDRREVSRLKSIAARQRRSERRT